MNRFIKFKFEDNSENGGEKNEKDVFFFPGMVNMRYYKIL